MPLSHNLFAFAPKELSHSAFWAWVFEGLNTENERIRDLARNLLQKLGAEYPGGCVAVSTEHSFGDGCRVDIAVSFEDQSHLFVECKRSAPVAEDQIIRYQQQAGDKTQIAVLSTHFDTSDLDELNVSSLDTRNQGELLAEYRGTHPIVDQYADWIDDLRSRRANLQKKAVSSDSSDVEEALSTCVGQWHLMRQITKDIAGDHYRGINRGGTPWTQYAICSSGDEFDRLFYRIDNYKSGYYFSLRQYLGSRDHPAWDNKEERLVRLRRWWNEAVEEVQPNLNFKAPHNRGTKECEIGCLMLKDNPPAQIIRELPAVQAAFVDRLESSGWTLYRHNSSQ
jgi:hypothetical protein